MTVHVHVWDSIMPRSAPRQKGSGIGDFDQRTKDQFSLLAGTFALPFVDLARDHHFPETLVSLPPGLGGAGQNPDSLLPALGEAGIQQSLHELLLRCMGTANSSSRQLV